MKNHYLLILCIISLVIFVHPPTFAELGPPDFKETAPDYNNFKFGTGSTFETALSYTSATYGYYVNPSVDKPVISQDKKALLNGLTNVFDYVSTNLGGDQFDRDRLYYGAELSGAWVQNKDITNKVDITTIGKAHYWFGEDALYYFGLGGGFAYNELRDENEGNDMELNLGGHLFFASEVEFGTRFNINGEPHILAVTWAHRSNAGIEDDNTGLNPVYLSLVRKF